MILFFSNGKQLMILVNDAGEAYSRIDHSPWNGCTLADFVMPFFLFIVGVSIALALKVQYYMYVTPLN
jgi:heparan-alpha-glucosaminide N-acetyltransferase